MLEGFAMPYDVHNPVVLPKGWGIMYVHTGRVPVSGQVATTTRAEGHARQKRYNNSLLREPGQKRRAQSPFGVRDLLEPQYPSEADGMTAQVGAHRFEG